MEPCTSTSVLQDNPSKKVEISPNESTSWPNDKILSKNRCKGFINEARADVVFQILSHNEECSSRNLLRVVGDEGTGKTTPAKSYANYHDHFRRIIWIDSEEGSAFKSFLKLARHLQLKNRHKMTLLELSHNCMKESSGKDWLFVFNWQHESDFQFSSILNPSLFHANAIIIQTPDHNVCQNTISTSVKSFDCNEREKYMSKGPRNIHMCDIPQLYKLCGLLNNMPLALKIAAASINEQKMTLMEYMEYLRIKSTSKANISPDKEIDITLAIALDLIKIHETKLKRVTISILHIFGNITPCIASSEFFAAVLNEMITNKAGTELHLVDGDIQLDSGISVDKDTINGAIDLLERYSIISKTVNVEGIFGLSIDPRIQMAINRLTTSSKEQIKNQILHCEAFLEYKFPILKNSHFEQLEAKRDFLKACKDGDFDKVTYLVNRGADVDMNFENDSTPLLQACVGGHLDIVKYLDEMKADMTAEDSSGKGVLRYALESGNKHLVKYLLENGISNSITEFDDQTIFHINDSFGDLDLTEYLKEIKAVVFNKKDELHFKGHIPFNVTFSAKHLKTHNKPSGCKKHVIVETKGVCKKAHSQTATSFRFLGETDSNYLAKHLNAQLQCAITGDKVELVRHILEQGANVNLPNYNGMNALHTAAKLKIDLRKLNNLEIMKLLIKDGKAHLDATTNEGECALHLAISANKFEAVKYLLRQGASINTKDFEGRCPLHLAVEVSTFEIINHLIAERTRVDWFRIVFAFNQETHIKETLLHIAARRGDANVVKLLLEKSIDLQHRNIHYETALHEAARTGSTDIVEMFVSYDSSLINYQTMFGDTALHNASVNGHLKTVEILMANGADTHIRNARCETALHLASEMGNYAVVKYLLKINSEIESQTYEGNTPLHIAALNGHEGIVKLLLSRNANFQVRNYQRETPLHLADNALVVRELIEAGALIGATTSQLPLHYFAIKGNVDCMVEEKNKYPNEFEILVNQGDVNGRRPIHLAALKGHLGAIQFLMQEGAKINVTDAHDLQPIHLAAREGHKDVVEYILKCEVKEVDYKKIPKFATDKSGMHSLHLAAREGHIEVVEVLLKNKVRFDLQNINGIVPIHLAARNLHVDVIDLLSNSGADVSVTDVLTQTFETNFVFGLYSKCTNFVREAIEYITRLGAGLPTDQTEKEKHYFPHLHSLLNSNDNFTSRLRIENLGHDLQTECIKTFAGFCNDLQSLVKESLKVINFSFKNPGDSRIEDEMKQITENVKTLLQTVLDHVYNEKKKSDSNDHFSVGVYYLLFLLNALNISLLKWKYITVDKQQLGTQQTSPKVEYLADLDAKEFLMNECAKIFKDYSDLVDRVINSESKLNEVNSKRQIDLFKTSLYKLNHKRKLNKNTLTLDEEIVAHYLKLKETNDNPCDNIRDNSIQICSIYRVLQVVGDPRIVNRFERVLNEMSKNALVELRNKYLSHLKESGPLFARLMSEYGEHTHISNCHPDITRIWQFRKTTEESINLGQIVALRDRMNEFCKRNDEIVKLANEKKQISANLTKRKDELIIPKLAKIETELQDLIFSLKSFVTNNMCVEEKTEVITKVEKYFEFIGKDENAQWKYKLGLPLFYKRLNLLKDKVLKESYLAQILRNSFKYSGNQNRENNIVLYLKGNRKTKVLAGMEFLIFDLRSILIEPLRFSNIAFDKKLKDVLDNLLQNLWLRDYLAHAAHGNRVCHSLTDLAEVVAFDAQTFINKGASIIELIKLSLKIRQDKQKWSQDFRNRKIFAELFKSHHAAEYLQAIESLFDVNLLGEIIEKLLTENLTDLQLKNKILRSSQKVELLSIFQKSVRSCLLKPKIITFLCLLTWREFMSNLTTGVNTAQQSEYIKVLENIVGRGVLLEQLKTFVETKERVMEILKSNQDKKYLKEFLTHFEEVKPVFNNSIRDTRDQARMSI